MGAHTFMQKKHINNVDMYFRVSDDTLETLRSEAAVSGRTVVGMFRKRAAALVADGDPQFANSARKCTRYIGVGISERMRHRLQQFAAARAVPYAALGELVASYIWRGGFRP